MKAKLSTLTLFTLLFFTSTFAQDTLITANDHRFKVGVKFNFEKSGDYYYEYDHDGNNVICFGVQAIRKIKQTKSSFESGIYFTTKVKQYSARYTNTYNPTPPYYYNFPLTVYHHYLTIPINYRLDTKSIYFAAGLFGDINLYHNARTNEEYVDSIQHYSTGRNFYLGWNVNLGMEKSISYRMDIYVEARLAVTVSSLKKEDGGFFMTTGNIGSSNVNYGFGVGANYKLGQKSK